jgi:hypothetical protein
MSAWPLRSYHFDLGDSNAGPVGYCARVFAETSEEAVEILRRCIKANLSTPLHLGPDDHDIEYLELYFNEEAITVDAIDDEEPVDDDGGFDGAWPVPDRTPEARAALDDPEPPAPTDQERGDG